MSISNEETSDLSDLEEASEQEEIIASNLDNKRKRLDLPQKKAKKSKSENAPGKTKNERFKPPTVEELNDLKLTENLYNNNLFRLQIEEVIKEVTIKQKRHKALKLWLDTFEETLKNWPETELLLSKIDKLGKKYKCPFKTDQDLTIKLLKPDYYKCFGLYDNEALAGPTLECCLKVTMPKSCLHAKDFLNNRYLVKRFYYLAYIAERLPKLERKELILHENNVLLPILLIQPGEDEKLVVKIYVTPSEECFKPSRFLPDTNNMKKDLFDYGINDFEAPTFLYNTTLAYDVTLSANSDYLKATLKDQQSVREGIKLLTIWLKQRELDVGHGAFTSDLIMYLAAYLLVKRKINKFMSSYQVVRNFWHFLATAGDRLEISLGPDNFESFKKHFDLVFLDVTGFYNLAAFLDVSIYNKVRAECRVALGHLDRGKTDSFQTLFLTKVPFRLQFDMLLDLTEALPLDRHFIFSEREKLENIGYKEFLGANYLGALLKRGLNKRVVNVQPRIEVTFGGIRKVTFGISLNSLNAFNFIEMGPELSDVQPAEEFRQFWGHLSSDRRFRDGSTRVAVYFKTSTQKGKRGIPKRIIKYLLMEKLKLNSFKLHYDEFEEFILNKKLIAPYPSGTNEETTQKIIATADDLGQKIRESQMSLHITGIQGITDTFSYGDPFPVVGAKFNSNNTEIKWKNAIFGTKKLGMIPRFVQPLEMVLQLERSSKWPNDLEAIRFIKSSFYLEIGKLLSDKHNVISNVTTDYLQVFYQGLVFRYRLYVPKEVASMKKQTNDVGATIYTDNAETINYEKTLDLLPKVNAALRGIQAQFPSFGPGTALIKRWLRSQLIDNHHLPDIVVNLLNASMYLNVSCYDECCSPQIGFLRFLKFLTDFQWQLQPLIVNFNEEISKEDLAQLESEFQQKRASLQPLYIITPQDQGRSVFTKPHPTREIMCRLQQLAEASLNIILRDNLYELKELFMPNMEGYDLLIHLRPLLNPRRHEQIDNPGDSKIVLEPYEWRTSEKIPITDFNPIESYLRTLRINYSDFATFFHDTYGGNVIAVLWNPKINEAKDFKVSYVNGRKLVDGKLLFNKDAVIEDFYIWGKGLVKSIEER